MTGPDTGTVFPEGLVADMMQCLDGPVAADQGSEGGGAGEIGGQAGDHVHGFLGGALSLGVAAVAHDPGDLGGVGEGDVVVDLSDDVQGGGEQEAFLGAAVGRVEFFNDEAMVIMGTDRPVMSASLGWDRQVAAGIRFRVEGRWIGNERTIFTDGDGDAARDNWAFTTALCARF